MHSVVTFLLCLILVLVVIHLVLARDVSSRQPAGREIAKEEPLSVSLRLGSTAGASFRSRLDSNRANQSFTDSFRDGINSVLKSNTDIPITTVNDVSRIRAGTTEVSFLIKTQDSTFLTVYGTSVEDKDGDLVVKDIEIFEGKDRFVADGEFTVRLQ